MSQSETPKILSPEVFQVWQQRAEASEEFTEEWQDYAMIMAAFQAALERALHTAEDCEQVDIEHLLITELEHLADLVNTVFPRGGFMEFASYVTVEKKMNARGEL